VINYYLNAPNFNSYNLLSIINFWYSSSTQTDIIERRYESILSVKAYHTCNFVIVKIYG